MDAQWSSVHSLTALQFNFCNPVCTQVALMGFWKANVRCDELLPCVDRGVQWGVGVGKITCWQKICLSLFFRVGE